MPGRYLITFGDAMPVQERYELKGFTEEDARERTVVLVKSSAQIADAALGRAMYLSK